MKTPTNNDMLSSFDDAIGSFNAFDERFLIEEDFDNQEEDINYLINKD